MIRSLIVAFFVFVVPQTLLAQTSKSDPKAQAPRQNPASDKEKTAAPPIIVNVIRPEKTEQEASDQRQEAENKAKLDSRLIDLTADLASYTRWLAYATVGLVIFTAVLAGFAYKQGRDARELFLRDQRPWMTLNGSINGRAEVNAHSNVVFTIAISSENVGKSPAVEAAEGSTRLIYGGENVENELEGLREFTERQSANIGRTIFPKQPASWTVNLSVNIKSLNENFEKGLGAPQIFIAACWLYKSPMRPTEFMETTKVFMLQGGIFRSDLRSVADIRADDLRLGLVETRETIT